MLTQPKSKPKTHSHKKRRKPHIFRSTSSTTLPNHSHQTSPIPAQSLFKRQMQQLETFEQFVNMNSLQLIAKNVPPQPLTPRPSEASTSPNANSG